MVRQRAVKHLYKMCERKQCLSYECVQAQTTSDNTSLRIDSSTRQDSGKYTITAKNEYGKDSADIEVIVVDKPGIPKGPLSYSNTTQDSVSLAWNPPADDGGGDITGIFRKFPLLYLCVSSK